MPKVRWRLGEADRERLGGPEWVEYDSDVLMAAELCAIYDAWGYTPAQWHELSKANNPLVLIFSVWAARRRAGVREDLSTFDFNMADGDEEPVGAPAEAGPGNRLAGEKPAPAKRARKTAPRKSATQRTTRAR